jgi:hypothetical protein
MIQIPTDLKNVLKPDAPLYRPDAPMGRRCSWALRWTITNPSTEQDRSPYITIEPDDWGTVENMTEQELIWELEDLLGRGVRVDEVLQFIQEPKTGSWRRRVGKLLLDTRPHYPEIPLHQENRMRYSMREGG